MTTATLSKRPQVRLWVGGLLLIAVVGYVTAAAVVQTQPRAPEFFPDPGPLTRWGLPMATVLRDLSLCFTGGFLLIATGRSGWPFKAAFVAVLAALGSVLAMVWLTVSDIFAISLMSALQPRYVGVVVSQTAIGRFSLLLLVGLACLALLLARNVSDKRKQRVVALLVLAMSLVAPAFSGHAFGAGEHLVAALALWLHLVGVVVWVGGVLALCLRSVRGSLTIQHCKDFSAVALPASMMVAGSGVYLAVSEVGFSSAWVTQKYGVLLIAKLVGIVIVIVFGGLQRRAVASDDVKNSRILIRREALILALVMGLAVALSRTPTP